jgi:hypothetical protein
MDDKGRPLAGEVDEETLARLEPSQELKLQDTDSHKRIGRNPYDGGSTGAAKKLKKRNSLDYLRALSEEIKKRRETGEGEK